MSAFRRSFIIALLAGMAAALTSCGRKEKAARSAVTEAYSLMDRGQNAKAAEILEKEVAAHPTLSEPRVLLASAYLGMAGVNVYSFYDKFNDLLFRQPLSERILPGANSGSGLDVTQEWGHILGALPADDSARSPIGKYLVKFQAIILQGRDTINFLNRFPDVEKKHWPLFDRALDQLDFLPAKKDILIYRIFVRVIYLKAYLKQVVVADPDFGTRAWVCRFDPDEARDHIEWTSAALARIAGDVRVFREGGSPILEKLRLGMDQVSECLDELGSSYSVEKFSGVARLRRALQCNSI